MSVAGPVRDRLRATFVMESHLGHQTFYENLRAAVAATPDVDARWIEVTYDHCDAWWEHAPLVGDGLRGVLRGRSQVRSGLADAADDVRFFNTQVPAVLGGALARERPYVLCTDVTPVQYDAMAAGYGHDPDGHGARARLKHSLNVRNFRRASSVVAWSSWVRESVIEDYGVHPDRVEVIPPGVDLGKWAARSGRARLPDWPVRILFVGGDFVRKGGDRLLHAFGYLPPGSAELVLVTRTRFAGGRNIRVLNDVQPNTQELRNVFRSSDIFVLPSAAETFGIAAVEAAASGLPVVASAVGGLADIVADGETGFLVAPSDMEALVAGLHKLVASRRLREWMGLRARRRAEQRFDATMNGRRIIDLLHHAASPGTPAALAFTPRPMEGSPPRRIDAERQPNAGHVTSEN